MEKNLRHLISNARNDHFDSAYQLFINYRDGLNDFNKDIEKANEYFYLANRLLQVDLFLQDLYISNYKKISKLNVVLHKHITVFIGDNGVGKTTILYSIRKALMWIAASIRKENASGGTISDDEINNEAKTQKIGAYIDCNFCIGSKNKVKGRLARNVDFSNQELRSELIEYRKFGQIIRDINDYKNINLPLFAFYGIDRLQQRNIISTDLIFNKADGYDESLTKGSNFHIFLEWQVQLLKKSKSTEAFIEKEKIKEQIKSLQDIGANEKGHTLYEMLVNLKNQLEQIDISLVNSKAKQDLGYLEAIYREIYVDFKEFRLVNEDDGKDKVAMVIGDESYFLHQLSDGQRVFLGLIGDIARRLILLNDVSDNPFNGQGIVLIDEIELHLHPKWQQKILIILRKCFPNIQYIVTTHSPHVITTVEPECVRSISDDGYTIPNFTLGAESNVVLEDVFKVDSRPQDVEEVKLLDEYRKYVDSDEWDSEDALKLRQRLDKWGRNKEVALDKLDMEIAFKKFKRSKNEGN